MSAGERLALVGKRTGIRDWPAFGAAVTVAQPWAALVAGRSARPCQVLNMRHPPPPALCGRWLAIHSGERMDRVALRAVDRLGDLQDVAGSVLALAEVTGFMVLAPGLPPEVQGDLPGWARHAGHVLDHPWAQGPVVWLLDRVHPLAPVPVGPGQDGVWLLDEDAEARVGRAYSAAVALGVR